MIVGFLDFILNLSALLLWLNWSYLRLSPREPVASGISLAGTLRTTAAPRVPSWPYLAGLIALLLIRAVVYFTIGSNLRTNMTLSLGIVPIAFNPRLLLRMFLFSGLSFVVFAGMFYFGLILLALVNRRVTEADTCLRLVRLHLGRAHRWPTWVQVMLPGAIAGLFWAVVFPLLEWLGLFPEHASTLGYWLRMGLFVLYAYMSWVPPLIAVLLLYTLASYVYFGDSAFWNFVQVSGSNLLGKLRLQSRRIDWAPLAALAVLLWVGWKGRWGLVCGGARLLVEWWNSVR